MFKKTHNKKKIPSILPHIWKNEMHSYNVREAFFQTCNIYIAWVRGPDQRAGLVWSYSENFIVLNLRKFSFLLIYIIN